MKKLYNLLCLAACVFCLAACSSENTTEVSDLNIDEDAYKDVITSNLQFLSEYSNEELQSYIDMYGDSYSSEIITLFNNWMNTRDEVGEYIGVLDWDFTENGDELVVVAKVDYEKRDAEFKSTYLEDGSMSQASFNVSYTLGEKMKKAALNTVIGMGTVFIVLILISLIIGCFKYISVFEQKLEEKKNKKAEDARAAAESVDNTIAQIVEKEEGELVDDLELAAVISAAVAAYTGTSSDGFVVRSIRKSNKKRWLNA
jgi:sodium pump decarboxylase gamma subunit